MVDAVTNVLRIRNVAAAASGSQNVGTQDNDPNLNIPRMCEFLLEVLHSALSGPPGVSASNDEKRDYHKFLNSLRRLDLPFASLVERCDVASDQCGAKMAEDCAKLHKKYNDAISTISNGRLTWNMDRVYAALRPGKKAADKWLQTHNASKSG